MPGTFEIKQLSDTTVADRKMNSTSEDKIPRQPLQSWKGQETRVQKSIAQFTQKYGNPPTFFVRVPGRVNLIGEHVDYCGYGVFPMAIEQDVFIAGRAVSVNSDGSVPQLRLTNTGEDYKDFECSLNEMKEILESRKMGVAPGWHLYFMCGALGILEHVDHSPSFSLEFCVDGRVPQRAGLSSSSALVCAAALATLVANNGEMSKKELAGLCAKSERYIGTEGGGMDQAIAILATAGTAQHIEFVPQLSGEKVELPNNAVFVIANSLADANKAATSCYNMRVAECRLSTWILGKSMGVADCFLYNRIKDLQLHLLFDLKKMLELVDAFLHPHPYSIEEVAQILEIDVKELQEKPLLSKLSNEISEFKLYQRIKHVLQEAKRVSEFRQVCEEQNESSNSALEKLGRLMNASHQSLQELYECSHPTLDKLVMLSQPLTHGARLTGAGWGGCMVALLDESQVALYLESLKKNFYQLVHGIDNIDQHVFITQPGAGATIYIQ